MNVGDRVIIRAEKANRLGFLNACTAVIIEPRQHQLEDELTVLVDGYNDYYYVPVELLALCPSPEPALDPTSKATNPKDIIGSDKLPLHLWPETATMMGCLGLLEGALKYGRSNWRETGVRVSIYVDALRRHTNAYFEGEYTDPDSGMPHLAHMLACIAIIVDAQAAGKLTDDRQYPGGYRELVEELAPLVPAVKAKHADKSPKHWTIKDAS